MSAFRSSWLPTSPVRMPITFTVYPKYHILFLLTLPLPPQSVSCNCHHLFELVLLVAPLAVDSFVVGKLSAMSFYHPDISHNFSTISCGCDFIIHYTICLYNHVWLRLYYTLSVDAILCGCDFITHYL